MLSGALRYISLHRWELVRFSIVGVATFALYSFLIWLFYGKAGLGYQLAISIAYFLTVVTHFFLNRSFTYGQKNGPTLSHISKYGILLVVNYLITLGVAAVTVELLGLTPYFAAFFSTLATVSSSFIIMKHFVFFEKESVQ